ncbi:hypothetical protein Tco_1108905 [Tanacetum coccineum]
MFNLYSYTKPMSLMPIRLSRNRRQSTRIVDPTGLCLLTPHLHCSFITLNSSPQLAAQPPNDALMVLSKKVICYKLAEEKYMLQACNEPKRKIDLSTSSKDKAQSTEDAYDSDVDEAPMAAVASCQLVSTRDAPEEHLDSVAETEIDDIRIPYHQISLDTRSPKMFPTEVSADTIDKISCSNCAFSDIVVPPISNCLCEDLRSACDRELTQVLELEAEISKQKQLISESEKTFAFHEQNYVPLKVNTHSRTAYTEKLSAFTAENTKLKAQVTGTTSSGPSTSETPKVLAPGMYNLRFLRVNPTSEPPLGASKLCLREPPREIIVSLPQFCDGGLEVAFLRQHSMSQSAQRLWWISSKVKARKSITSPTNYGKTQIAEVLPYSTYGPLRTNGNRKLSTERSHVLVIVDDVPPVWMVFGSLCYPTNDYDDVGKLKAKADIGIFVGYAPTKKAYRIYNKRTRKIQETVHVAFDELTEGLTSVQTGDMCVPRFDDDEVVPIPPVVPITPVNVPAAPAPENAIGSPSTIVISEGAPAVTKPLPHQILSTRH